MSKVNIYKHGLVYCSVCAPSDMDTAAVTAEVNLQMPTGIESTWRISKDKTFASGQPNPCPCEVDASRLHHLMEC